VFLETGVDMAARSEDVVFTGELTGAYLAGNPSGSRVVCTSF